MIRILTLIFGLMGAASLSQFPEFSQQYLQRLAGAVDELSRVVDDFDRSAEATGLTRDQALAALNQGAFQQRRREDMTRTIARHARLSTDLQRLRDAPMALRAVQPHRFADAEIAAAAWQDFKPAVPVTMTGAGFAGVGFLGGVILGWPILRLLAWPLRRLRRRPPARRVDPPVSMSQASAAAGLAREEVGMNILARAIQNREPRRVVAYGGSAQVTTLSVAPREDLNGQVSAEGDMVLCAVEGQGRVSWGGRVALLQTGSMVIVPAGAVYSLSNSDAAPLQLFATEPRGAHGLRAVPVATRGDTS